MTDEEIIRKALEQVTIQGPLRVHIEAMERLTARCIPELPPGYRVVALGHVFKKVW
jgi:hypothetical protein